MQITKLEHACMILETGRHRLVIDPGGFTTPITDAANADGVVITHQHADHWTPEQLARIAAQSPDVEVFTTAATAAEIADAEIEGLGDVHIVTPGDSVQTGNFALEFFGGDHAEIHTSIPRIDNIGVVVNGVFGYPGDSYALPSHPEALTTLAVAANAPWMRLADSMDYVAMVRPKTVIGVHEMLLSQRGKELAAARLEEAAERTGGTLAQLAPFDSIEIDD